MMSPYMSLKKLEMNEKLQEKDAEIEKLEVTVKELEQELSDFVVPESSKIDWEGKLKKLVRELRARRVADRSIDAFIKELNL